MPLFVASYLISYLPMPMTLILELEILNDLICSVCFKMNFIKLWNLLNPGKKTLHRSEKRKQPAIAAMHGPHNVFDIGRCTVIHCDTGGCRWLTNEKQRKN